ASDLREAAGRGARGLHRRGRLPRRLQAHQARAAPAGRDHLGHRLPQGGLRLHRREPAAGPEVSALTFLALRELADGRFHSGEDVARVLGRSRATVNEALKRAPDLGLELFSVRGKGYRLAAPIEFLDAAALTRSLE